MLVERPDSATAIGAQRAERQSPHERSIEHHARDEGGHEKRAHQPQEQHAGQAKEEVRVQLQDKFHEPARGCQANGFAAAAIEEQKRHLAAR